MLKDRKLWKEIFEEIETRKEELNGNNGKRINGRIMLK